ncbi:GGDEF domain-containing protein [Devosia sp.]|uniref:GGDEF domain-containing protein n=1 Tax=Devosia sp. TaxID=1871048 RepID=UPI002FCC4B14
MTELRRELPRRAWRRIGRVTGAVTAISVALSVIFTNLIMEMFSAGINVQGLVVSIVMPIALGGPMTFVLVLKHEQLRHANNRLEHLATTDWLTACLNRGAFTRAVTDHLGRRKSATESGALLIVDADDFKSVNDRFGHHHGDEALKLIAAAIRHAVRSSDLVSRLGGEEFGVFLADADAATADHVAERIRGAVAAIAFLPDGQTCALSVSIGGATYAMRAEFGHLYRLADRHLYEAKNTGRDRVAMMQAA